MTWANADLWCMENPNMSISEGRSIHGCNTLTWPALGWAWTVWNIYSIFHKVIKGYITWALRHQSSLATQLLVQKLIHVNHKEAIKSLHYWPFEVGKWWISCTKHQSAQKVCIYVMALSYVGCFGEATRTVCISYMGMWVCEAAVLIIDIQFLIRRFF